MVILLPMIGWAQSKEADVYYKKGEELYNAEKYEEALSYFEKSYSITKKQQGDTMNSKASIMLCCAQLAKKNDAASNYTEAISYWKRIVDLYKELFGIKDTLLPTLLSSLANDHYRIGNYPESIKFGTQAMEICHEVLGEEHPDYARSLNNLASYNSSIGNYTEAIRLGTQALEIDRKNLGEEHPAYATSLSNLANYNDKIGNYTEAIRLGTQALEIRRKALGEEHPHYANSLNNLAYYYDDIGNYTEAIRLCSQALEIRRKGLGEEHPDYATSLNNLASYYDDIGNYTEAIKLGSQALEILRKTLGEEHPHYATSLSGLASYNHAIGNYAEAIRLGTQALEILRKVLDKEHPDYATSLSNLAVYNDEIGNYTEAIRLGTQALEIRRKVLGEEHPDYAGSLNNLANYNTKIGNYTEAIRLGTQALEIFKKTLGEEHPDYAQSLNNLAIENFKAGNYDESAKLFKQCFERKKNFVLKNFASMTEKERANFWSINSQFFSDRLPYCAYKHPTPTFATIAYNGQLLSKGLLLNAELEVQKNIAQSGNKDLEKRYYSIRKNRIRLDKLYQQPISRRTMNVDSIASLIEKDQQFLMEHIKELGDYTRNLAIKWEDVRNKLSDKDIAIEFADFDDDDEKHIYLALVLKKGKSAPELVKLFSEDQLTAIKAYQTKNYNDSPTLYNLLWKPLEKYLNGVENIYFSPSGKLHTIAIEYLPDDSGEIFANKYNAYRLSSTRELAIEHTVNHSKKVATYGGVQYNLYVQDFENLKNSIADNNDVFRDFPLIANSQKLSEGFVYSENTKEEVETITESLKSAGYSGNAKYQKDATEESFKNLSGKGLQILHIATHGFYEEEKKLAKTNLSFFNKDNPNQEDRSLSCSGLAMAGANNTLDSVNFAKIPEGFDDGILTAKEISRLDFKGLDLVVLSACQTGLGEVTGEGVFGLQRGFKKAGANTILMSLWKVGDKATKDLMIEFYKNLTNGKSKREAFIAAQDYLRKTYKNPYYWAAFVMVDGLK